MIKYIFAPTIIVTYLFISLSTSHGFTSSYYPSQSGLSKRSPIHVKSSSTRIQPCKQLVENHRKNNLSSTILLVAPPSVIESVSTAVKIFSPSALRSSSATMILESVTSVLLNTPPSVFFICLLMAGFGVPISGTSTIL